MDELIDNEAWLAGYAARQRGLGCPWGNPAARQGWLVAKADAGSEVPSHRALLSGIVDP
jgi:hypothetical protein